jgi:hypothetical protein
MSAKCQQRTLIASHQGLPVEVEAIDCAANRPELVKRFKITFTVSHRE